MKEGERIQEDWGHSTERRRETNEKNKTGAKPGCDEIQYALLKTKTKASRSFQIAKREFPAGWSSHKDKTTASR